jgi:heparanase 1
MRRMRIAVAAVGLLLVAGCHGCGQRDPRLHVAVASDRVVATVSDRFVSLAIDTAQVVGGDFWTAGQASTSGVGPVAPFAWERPRLAALTRALAPAYLRIGGTDADRTWYALGDGPPPAIPPENYKWTLTRTQLDGAFAFARANDLQLMLTLNAGRGPRAAADGPWLPDNARTLVAYAAAQAAPVAVWEMGNEVNAYVVTLGFSLAPADYARDVRVARGLVTELMPAAKLAAPASAYWPLVGELGGLLPAFAEVGGDSVDILSWHYYPQQSGRCGVAVRSATPTRLLDADNLDEIDRWAKDVEDAQQKWAPRTEVWLGETSNAQCGGAPGISDAHVSALWWLDELGKMARRGTQVVVRQSLTGADYGLLAEPSLAPRPDYFATLLWKRLMGTRALAVTVPAPPWTLRAYAHCAGGEARPGAVTVLLINLDQTQPATLALDGVGDGKHELYVVSAAGLGATTVSLNDRPLAVADDGTPPPLEGRAGRGRSVTIPPVAYAFVRFDDAHAAACAAAAP